MIKTKSSKLVAFVAVFAAIDVILSAIPAWWISWAAVIKPLHGIFLGPVGGVLAAFIGGIIGNIFWPQTAILALFTWVPGLVGAFGVGLLVKRQWKPVAVILAILIVGFYLHPIGKTLALWALYDKVIALILIYPATMLMKKVVDSDLEWKYLAPTIMLVSFVGTQIDNTVGNDLFIFLRLYELFGISADALLPLYVTGAFVMTAQRIVIAIIAGIVGAPLLKFTRSKGIPCPLT
jgi:hypothetical protein